MPAAFSLPSPSEFADTLTRHYHAEFMHAFYALKENGPGRVYHAICNAAQRTGSTPEAVAKSLVECGLRGPREFFPEKFASALEKTARDPDIYRARLTPSQKELLQNWRPLPLAARFLLGNGRAASNNAFLSIG